MRFVISSLFLMLSAAQAFAAGPQQFQPVTLSPEEYQGMISALMQRDPLIQTLLTKQNKAQEDAALAVRQEWEAKKTAERAALEEKQKAQATEESDAVKRAAQGK